MIIALMRIHVLSMNIHHRKLHVLLTMEAFGKPVMIYAFQLKRIEKARKLTTENNPKFGTFNEPHFNIE